ncbi:MAG: DUF1028 domain-containing protein [Thermoplasmata archaeon]
MTTVSLPPHGTFSIVAWDPGRGEWGVAIQSKFIAAGAVVPWGQAGVGALATQASSDGSQGPKGLELLRKGLSASEVVARLSTESPDRDDIQLGVVDGKGRAAAFTGAHCLEWAGHIVGNGYSCQGNILYSGEVVRGMARTFETTPGDLPERLLAALVAGQREGGDRRGMQSAALLVWKERGGYRGGLDRWIDVRVDDHATPIEELDRIFRIYDMTLLSREDPASLRPLDAETVRSVQRSLGVLGYLLGPKTGMWDAATARAFEKFVAEHNFENKVRTDGTIWPSIVRYLDLKSTEELARRETTAPIRPGALDQGPGGGMHGAPPSNPPGGGSPSSTPANEKAPRRHRSK